MIKCVQAEKLILLQDSDELKPTQACNLERHLADCESCRQFRHALLETANAVSAADEPSIKVIQNVLRTARVNAPEQRRSPVLHWKPAVTVAAVAVAALGLFLGNYQANKVGIELELADIQLLEPEDQVVSVMYEGLSEDDLAFNFLMTYEDDMEG